MTITKLFIYIAVFATVVLFAAMATRRTKQLLVNWVQFFVGGLFMFSGVVKAIDPIGTAIKMEEYFEVFIEYVPALTGFWHFCAEHALAIGSFMIILEIFLAITLLLGKYKKLTVWLLLLIILFFTFLTGFSHVTGKVTDCGCFGDFLKLTPYQSFIKDIILTALILILFFGQKVLAELFPPMARSGLTWILTVGTILFTFSNIRDLPIVDFRAYQVGVNIEECTQLPPDAIPYKYEIVFIYKNKATGEEKEFVNSYPEDFSAWDYVDRKDKLLQKGDDPKCKDFTISDIDGNEVTDAVYQTDGKLFLITSYDLSRAKPKGLKRMAKVAEAATAAGYEVMGITGSSLEDAEDFRHEYGLGFEFYNLDAVPIKTMNRSNPGLVVVDDGTILGKWHYNKVGRPDAVLKSLEK